jgi:hypothetical protein
MISHEAALQDIYKTDLSVLSILASECDNYLH